MLVERARIIKAINKPLGFLALLIVGIETMLGLTAVFSTEPDRSNLIEVAIAILLTSIFLAGFFALIKSVYEELKLKKKVLTLATDKTSEREDKEQNCQEQSLEFAIRSATVGEFLPLDSSFFISK